MITSLAATDLSFYHRPWETVRTPRRETRRPVVSDYVTAVKASDASMKCSTHAEATAPSELRQMFMNSFHSGWYVVPRASLRETNRHESSRDWDISQRSFRENASVTFRRHNKCERSDACLRGERWHGVRTIRESDSKNETISRIRFPTARTVRKWFLAQ